MTIQIVDVPEQPNGDFSFIWPAGATAIHIAVQGNDGAACSVDYTLKKTGDDIVWETHGAGGTITKADSVNAAGIRIDDIGNPWYKVSINFSNLTGAGAKVTVTLCTQ